MVVEPGIPEQSGFQVLSAVVAARGEYLGDPAIEAFDHAVGLWRSGFGQTVLNAERFAQPVELMTPRRLAILGAKQSIRELLAVVRQQPGDLDRAGLVQRVQEGASGSRRLVGLEGDVDPAGRTVYGDEEIAPGRLVGHLRQILDVHVQVAGFVGFEGLVRRSRQCLHRQARNSMTSQQTAQRRATGCFVDEFVGNDQQVIQRQPQGLAQGDNNGLLRRGEGGLQVMGRVRTVFHAVTILPAPDGVFRDAQFGCQRRHRQGRGLDVRSSGRRGRGVLVQADVHVNSLRSSSIRPRMTSRLTNNARRLGSMQSSGTSHLGGVLGSIKVNHSAPKHVPWNLSLQGTRRKKTRRAPELCR